ncbi:MAG: HEAT repeat domain-containing protein [Chitinophagaceae bacterium]|nr:HEAT repeat domain-containing protein [Chitinophagaceae bacterium]
MNCGFDQEKLGMYALQQLDEQEQYQVQQHVKDCADCAAELKQLEQLWLQTASLPEPAPDVNMKHHFLQALAAYQATEKAQAGKGVRSWMQEIREAWHALNHLRFRPVYGVAMMLIGILFTALFYQWKGHAGKAEVAALSGEVKEMREMLALRLLEHPSASERLRAVSYVEEIDTVDNRVKQALLATLNNDENVNVRLTALETLAKMSSDPLVREGLIQSIQHQDSPLVQSALADIMITIQEKKSVPSFRRLLKDPATNEMIKTKIRETIHQLS